MSYTNQTQHYGLPQYVATDIPAYLTDYNQAMATIDQGMNSAKTQAETAATAAGQAANDIAALQSTVNTQAAQISAAAQAASAAQTAANGADGKADTNAQAITGLDDRVTALEEGGGGGSDLIATEIVTITNAYRTQIPDKEGYVPAFANITSSTSGGMVTIQQTPTGTTGYEVIVTGIGGSGNIAILRGNYTIEVVYVKTA